MNCNKSIKILFFILLVILVTVSCEKEDNSFIPVENISQRIKSKKQYNNGILRSTINYLYDNTGRLISLETAHFNENGEPDYNVKRTFEYEQNKIVEYSNNFYTGVDSGFKTEKEIISGRVSKIISYQWNGEVWDLVSRTSYIYNGSKLVRWNIINLVSFYTNMIEGEIVYDGDLPVQKTEKHIYYDIFWNSVYKSTTYTKEIYDYTDGGIEEARGYYKWENMEDWKINYKLEYERSGQEIIEKYYRISQEETWIRDRTTISIYNEHGCITNTKIIYPESGYVYETVTEYENKPGNWELVLEHPEMDIYKITLSEPII